MATFIILLTLVTPVATLILTRKRSLLRTLLWVLAVQAVLTLVYCLTNGLPLADYLRGDSHGTVLLLFINTSHCIAGLGLVIRAIHALWRKKHPPTW